MTTSWRTKLASAVLLLLLVAAGLRVALILFAPAWPLLLVAGSLAAIYLMIIRRTR